MIYRRYPHSAHIELQPAATGGVNTGILGEDKSAHDTMPIRGRLERKSATDGTYKAIFYTGIIPGVKWTDFADGRLVYNDRSWNIVEILPYQTHTEIWLS